MTYSLVIPMVSTYHISRERLDLGAIIDLDGIEYAICTRRSLASGAYEYGIGRI